MATALKQPDSRPRLSDMTLFREANYVDGAWVNADSGETLGVDNPATGEEIGRVPNAGSAETERAVEAAHAAFQSWSRRTARERSRILHAWFDLIMANREDLAVLMTTEQGKPLVESRGEVAYGASFIEWFAEAGPHAFGEVVPSSVPSRRILALRQPVGVCAAITPWNFPIAMITRKVGPALAAGCTVIARPATLTPYCTLALAELAERAGVPKGVFNVLTGSSEAIGGTLCASKTVRKLTFTGSTEVGSLLIKQSADTVKKLSMELGGNAPFIVFDDADLEQAVAGAIACKFRNSGQTCVCANRIYVQDGIHDAFVAKFAEAAAALKVGNGMDEGVKLGPLINTDGVEKAERHVKDAVDKGAKVLTGGKRHALGGLFFEPTVLVDCSPDMIATREETFGPVAPIFRFTEEDEAVRMANDNDFGLASYFYTRDVARVFRVAEALESGIVGVNEGVISAAEGPFGGVKMSGIGREGGPQGLDEFLEVKYVALGGVA